MRRASNLATGKRDSQGEGRLSLHAVVAECAKVIQNAAITGAGDKRSGGEQGCGAGAADDKLNCTETRHRIKLQVE